MAKKRIYIITESHEVPPQRLFTNLRMLTEEAGDDYDLPSYSALYKRLERTRNRTGKSILRLKDKDGNPITVEIREIG